MWAQVTVPTALTFGVGATVHRLVEAAGGSPETGLAVTAITTGGTVLVALVGLATVMFRDRTRLGDEDRARDEAREQVLAEQAAEIAQLKAELALLRKQAARKKPADGT